MATLDHLLQAKDRAMRELLAFAILAAVLVFLAVVVVMEHRETGYALSGDVR